MFKYTINETTTGKLYFYVDEKWSSLTATTPCKEKLAMAQYSRKYTNTVVQIFVAAAFPNKLNDSFTVIWNGNKRFQKKNSCIAQSTQRISCKLAVSSTFFVF